MALGVGSWIRSLFKRQKQAEWNWSPQAASTPDAEFRPEPRVTLPQLPEEESDKPEARVVLGFLDGSKIALDDSHPLVPEFVEVADRMTRPARWRRLFTAKVGL